jgi:hypothetical protein
MKKKGLLMAAILVTAALLSYAQAPQSFKYQAVARNLSGDLITNQTIAVRIGILQGSTSGTSVYSETHSPQANQFGLFNLELGNGTIESGVFANIDWGSGPYYLKIEVDENNGTNFQLMGTSQLLSVPFALYSESTGDTSKWQKNNGDLYYNEGNIGIGTNQPDGRLAIAEINSNGEKAITIKATTQNTDTIYGLYTEVDAGTGLVENGRRVAIGSLTKVKNHAVASTLGHRPYAIGSKYIIDATSNSTSLMGNTKSVFGIVTTSEYWDGYSTDSVWQYGHFSELLAGGTGSASVNFVGRVDFKQESTPVPQTGYGFYAPLGKIGVADTFYAFGAADVNPNWIEGGIIHGFHYDVPATDFESNYAVFARNGKNFFGDTVGIGTQTPSALLDVSGDINFSGHLKFDGNRCFATPLTSNLFVGAGAGTNNTTGLENSFFGYMAGHANMDQSHNTFIGTMAGFSNTAGHNTFLGCNAGKTNTVGAANVFVGKDAGFSNLDQAHNTFVGFGSGYNNTAGNNTFVGCQAGSQNTVGGANVFVGKDAGFSNLDQAHNTFVGFGAGYNNTAGNNTFLGCQAGSSNTVGGENVFLGRSAGYSNLDQSHNTFVGFNAGYLNTAGNNTFIGCTAGASNVAGAENVFIGGEAGYSNFDQSYHIFIGYQAGYSNIASKNTFIGYKAGHQNSTGTENTFLGHQAGYSNTNAHNNVFIGYMAGHNTTTGWDNLFLGYYAGFSNTITGQNTYLGYEAGYSNSTGSGNIFIGYKAGYNETGSQKLYIDNTNTTSPLIYGEFDNDMVTINDVMKLAPRTSAPSNAQEGMMYYNGTTKKLMVFDGTIWQACW